MVDIKRCAVTCVLLFSAGLLVFVFIYTQKISHDVVIENNFDNNTSALFNDYIVIDIQNTLIHARVARTPEEREQGLSGTESLAEGEGLLFIFDKSDVYGFWMPDMNYAIDIIWFDEDFTVVDIKENATPESYPSIFRPRSPALYVLEVPSGYTKEKGILVGNKAYFQDIAQ